MRCTNSPIKKVVRKNFTRVEINIAPTFECQQLMQRKNFEKYLWSSPLQVGPTCFLKSILKTIVALDLRDGTSDDVKRLMKLIDKISRGKSNIKEFYRDYIKHEYLINPLMCFELELFLNKYLIESCEIDLDPVDLEKFRTDCQQIQDKLDKVFDQFSIFYFQILLAKGFGFVCKTTKKAEDILTVSQDNKLPLILALTSEQLGHAIVIENITKQSDCINLTIQNSWLRDCETRDIKLNLKDTKINLMGKIYSLRCVLMYPNGDSL